MNAGDKPCADARNRPADQAGRDGADDAGVDDGTLDIYAEIRRADGEQAENARKEHLLQSAVLALLQEVARRAKLGEHRCRQNQDADIEQKRNEEIIRHSARPPYAIFYILAYSARFGKHAEKTKRQSVDTARHARPFAQKILLFVPEKQPDTQALLTAPSRTLQ